MGLLRKKSRTGHALDHKAGLVGNYGILTSPGPLGTGILTPGQEAAMVLGSGLQLGLAGGVTWTQVVSLFGAASRKHMRLVLLGSAVVQAPVGTQSSKLRTEGRNPPQVEGQR
jgi:hypothetical protein